MTYKLQSDADSDKYRLWGDLLMANLYQLKDFTPTVSVYDYENEKQIELRLDETKTIKEIGGHNYVKKFRIMVYLLWTQLFG